MRGLESLLLSAILAGTAWAELPTPFVQEISDSRIVSQAEPDEEDDGEDGDESEDDEGEEEEESEPTGARRRS